ncbi:unnamed protein product [Microthlaspi erraticum]|uniref:DUF4218 domain-containing protein n=1 Tax=Microthlaspi erraticum TaxID=1685480 RepID=A0A6D2KAH4_9BRAS|nr:unnamed protein product [Microthlaspi erraticum]
MVEKDWVHLSRADPAYERGALNFVQEVAAAFGDVDMIICPCIDCRNIDRHLGSVIVDHLVTRGMDEAYKMRSNWYLHGELKSGVQDERNPSQWNDEIFGLFQAAEFTDEEFATKSDLCEIAEGEDREEDEFLAKLANAGTPLYPCCVSHSKLSVIVSLFRLKTQNGLSDKSFNDLLETLPEMLPEDNVLHTSLYEVKKFLKSFDMGYEKTHACVNDCCLFRKKYNKLEKCPKCMASRWKTNMHNGEEMKGVPHKVLRYFPIIPRLKRMLDSVTWDQMDEKYPAFAAEERNVRLGLSTDGFNPFNMKNSKYSCWPVLLVNYNLLPDLCMKKENIMLTLLIPGPKQPGNSLDVYLEPLIENLDHLWKNGEQTYDAFSKCTFNLRAMLLWTISDFPAYGNLAGCTVKGKMACPLCGKNTNSMWLKFSRKHVYMCHRKGLPPSHSYRGQKARFDGKAEHGRKGRILTGHEISQNLRNFKNDFGNLKQSASKRKKPVYTRLGSDSDDSESEGEEDEEIEIDKEELSRWKKRFIFFKLPYWEELPVRHNLDVMHIERNVAASIVSTVLHCGKSKDGIQARKDLEDLGIRKDLHPCTQGKRTYLPAAPWSLSKTEKKVFCRRLFDFKGPDGYCSDISRGVSLDDCKVAGLKSHDYHVLMQQLLPIALRGLLPKGPRVAIVRLCAFFSHLCQRVIDREQILVMEAEIVETLCMLERFFPPSFFDIMVHLTVHLGREVRLGGPVHFRWMYPFERYMKVMKDFVRNPARPEGCIAESYLAEECIQFCSEFLKKTTNVQDKVDRNTEYENSSILEGRPLSAGTTICLSEAEMKMAHLAVIQNMAVIDPYVEYLLIQTSMGKHSNGWRMDHVALHGPVCRSSAKDTSQVVDLVSYYGRVTDIILVDYNVFYVPLFRCQWAVKGNGVKVEEGFTLVNMNHSQVSLSKDPYILASHAKQVFYLREDESSNWHVVMRGPSRRYSKKEFDDGLADLAPLPSNVVMDIDMDEAESIRADCEGIYVLNVVS